DRLADSRMLSTNQNALDVPGCAHPQGTQAERVRTRCSSYNLSPRYCPVQLLAPHLFPAFSALFIRRSSRNLIRALCNCDLLFPIEHPTKSAISLCSYPSTSCSTKIVR